MLSVACVQLYVCNTLCAYMQDRASSCNCSHCCSQSKGQRMQSGSAHTHFKAYKRMHAYACTYMCICFCVAPISSCLSTVGRETI